MHSIRRMGIGAVATMLDLWCDRQLELSRRDYDELCSRLVDLLGDCRDEQWRLRGTLDDEDRHTSPDTEREPGV